MPSSEEMFAGADANADGVVDESEFKDIEAEQSHIERTGLSCEYVKMELVKV